MKVLINAINSKCGGFKTITQHIYNNLPEDNNEYYILVYKGSLNQEYKSNVKVIETRIGDSNYILRFFWYQLIYPLYLLKSKYDISLNLSNYGPIIPVIPQILLLHNPKHVSQEIRKNYNWIKKLKAFIEDFVLRISLIGTSTLIVQTNFMKNGVVRKFNFNPNNIVVIPNIMPNIKENNLNKDLEIKIDEFIKNKKFLLGNITLYSEYKNLYLLVDAIEEISKYNKNIGLIITISRTENEEAKRFIDYIENKNLTNHILSVGNIKNTEVHYILSKVHAFAFPTYMESFGVPFVEAMQYSLPIIAADLEFAHNVCEKAAIYFDETGKEQLSNCIEKLMNDNILCQQMSEYSFNRYKELSSIDFVKEYVDLCTGMRGDLL